MLNRRRADHAILFFVGQICLPSQTCHRLQVNQDLIHSVRAIEVLSVPLAVA
jgi:hypothetical protein